LDDGKVVVRQNPNSNMVKVSLEAFPVRSYFSWDSYQKRPSDRMDAIEVAMDLRAVFTRGPITGSRGKKVHLLVGRVRDNTIMLMDEFDIITVKYQ
jgi:hypothetical protein